MTDFAQIIRGIDGEAQRRPGTNGAADTLVDVTLGWLCRQVLASESPADQGEGGDAKITRIALAMRIGERELDLTAAEISLIRDRAARNFSAVAVYRLAELLDPAAVPGAERPARPADAALAQPATGAPRPLQPRPPQSPNRR